MCLLCMYLSGKCIWMKNKRIGPSVPKVEQQRENPLISPDGQSDCLSGFIHHLALPYLCTYVCWSSFINKLCLLVDRAGSVSLCFEKLCFCSKMTPLPSVYIKHSPLLVVALMSADKDTVSLFGVELCPLLCHTWDDQTTLCEWGHMTEVFSHSVVIYKKKDDHQVHRGKIKIPVKAFSLFFLNPNRLNRISRYLTVWFQLQ